MLNNFKNSFPSLFVESIFTVVGFLFLIYLASTLRVYPTNFRRHAVNPARLEPLLQSLPLANAAAYSDCNRVRFDLYNV